MRRQVVYVVTVILLVTILLYSFLIVLEQRNSKMVQAHTLMLSAALTAASSGTGGGIDWGNPAIIAALIGLAGLIIGAFIGGAFAVYQVRRNAQLERQKQEDQFYHDQEMARLQKELEFQYKVKEQEQQKETTRAEALRLKMLLDQTNSERAKTYRRALHADPRISHLQILDMSRPLEVTNIYVRVRVHQETRTSYELDSAIRSAEAQRDPNAILLAGVKHLEQRATSAVDPDEAIRSYKHCVIVGDPGAGKTTLLKYLTLKAADSQLAGLPDFPIRIELNAFVTSGYQDLLDFAAADWESRYNFPKTEARMYMEERLLSGEALLLLDALDETVIGETTDTAEASYARIIELIGLATTRYHRSPIVVTARKAGYQQRTKLLGFTELEVLDFRPEDIRQFVTNWFNCYEDPQKRANALELNAKLERTPRIQALAANPLLLSLIVLVYETQLDLPERRAELYKRCVDVLLTEWDTKRNIRRRREFKPEHKRQLLAELAWHFHQQGRRYFPENEVLSVIAAFLPKVHLPPEQNGQILTEIANEQGLLKEQAKGWQGFLHLTLQEYFVAQYVTDHQLLDQLIAHQGDPWWEEVLLLYAGYVPDASYLLHRLLARDEGGNLKDDLFCTNLLLAGQCLIARPTLHDVSLWETVIKLLFETLTTSPYSLTQERMAETLAAIGGAEIIIQLLQLLGNEQIEVDVRLSIAAAIGKLGERSVAPQLMALLGNEQIDTSVRQSIAAYALGDLGERSVAPQLIALLATKQIDRGIGMSIVTALGKLGERSATSHLVPLLANHQIDRIVRMCIADVLEKLGGQSVVPLLVPLLGNEQIDRYVRGRITNTIGGVGERSVAPQLVALLANKQINKHVRQGIAHVLGRLGERSVAPQLVALLATKQIDTSVRCVIMCTLNQLRERSVALQLVPLLTNEQLEVDLRRSIAYELGELGERSVAPQLVPLLANEQIDMYVREGIAFSLGELGERSVAPQLVPLLANEQIKTIIRQRIASSLGELGERSMASQLVPLLANEQIDKDVRQRIAKTLGMLADTEMIIHDLVGLLPTSDLADSIHRALQSASRQADVRIYMSDGQKGEPLRIVKRPSVER